MSEVNLTSKNYSEEVEKSTIPVLIDFGLLGVDHAEQ